MKNLILMVILPVLYPNAFSQERARDYGFSFGVMTNGPFNAITDVYGLKVGHFTILQEDHIRTGVTAILPLGGNIFQGKIPKHYLAGGLVENEAITPLFLATIEATKEAIINLLFAAETMSGKENRVVNALPKDKVKKMMEK